MNIDLSLVCEIIRKSLKEAREDGCSDDLCRQRALYHALKAMYILCKDQPRPPLEITGVERGSHLYSVIEVVHQSEYKQIMHTLPNMVRAISEEMKG